VDDLHLDFRNTGRLHEVFARISEELVQDGDMFGVVSTGTSSIAIPMTYDKRRLTEAAKKLAGGALTPGEIIDTPQGSQGPAEVRHRAHVAFATAADALRQLGDVHDRRKAFVYISNGYDLDPFAKTRAKNAADRYGSLRDNVENSDASDPALRPQGNQFAFADLAAELGELTRAAVRSNTSIYTIDPRGLMAGPDLDQNVDRMEFFDSVRTQQDSLRVLADLTGGLAVVNSNDVTPALKRIDQETSDYYLVGYYSGNPDPLKKRRMIEIKVKRTGAVVWHRPSYVR
jgi:VWFA-related protein